MPKSVFKNKPGNIWDLCQANPKISVSTCDMDHGISFPLKIGGLIYSVPDLPSLSNHALMLLFGAHQLLSTLFMVHSQFKS